MSLQALIQAGLNPHDAQEIAQRVQASGALTIDDAVVLVGRLRPSRRDLLTQARRAWWFNPAIPLEWKRLLDAQVVNRPDAALSPLSPVQAARQIVSAAKSAGAEPDETLPALYRLWVEARDRYLDLQEDDGTLPAEVEGMTWGELCALYVKADLSNPCHPAQVIGVFLEAFED